MSKVMGKTVRIAFTGPMKSGKTTGANAVLSYLFLFKPISPSVRGMRIPKPLSFADPVKIYAFNQFFLPTPHAGPPIETDDDKIEFVNDNKDFYRERLQSVGEHYRQQDPNYWVDQLHYRACLAEDRDQPALVIDDLRYRNEFEYCKKQGYVVIKLIPDFMNLYADRHPSEQEWFDLPADFTICKRMERPVTDYYKQLQDVLERLGL